MKRPGSSTRMIDSFALSTESGREIPCDAAWVAARCTYLNRSSRRKQRPSCVPQGCDEQVCSPFPAMKLHENVKTLART
jgi:hypothetical protein